MNKFKEPISCLKTQLDAWKQSKKTIQEVIYRNDTSYGSDNTHKFYKQQIRDCDKMIETYKQAINKLK